MKFLFITKPFFIEPLGIMYLSSAMKKGGHQVSLITTDEDFERKVSEFQPDFVGYSIMTGDQRFYDEINKKLKQKFNFVSVAGGPHPTFFPEFLEGSSFDAICLGEGEEAVRQLMQNPSSTDTPNFWFKTSKGIVKNQLQNFVENLDNLPFPDREIVFQYQEIRNGPIKHFIASRGCPFNCSYCFNASYSELYKGKGKRVRFRTVENLIKEIQEVISSSPTRFIYFQDDTFTLDRAWLDEFAEKYPARINLPFHCHVRPNTIDEEKILALKKAGCYSVHIAAETADDFLRNEILNRGMTKEQIFDASALLKKHGIRFMLQNIIGLPEGSLDKDFETLELNIKCRPDYAWVSIFQPYPKTILGEYCREKGFYIGDFDDLDSNFFDSSKLNLPEKYKNQIANLQKLFALAVEHPDLYNSGLLGALIDLPKESTKEVFTKLYRDFRKKGDEKLYGFSL
nr:hypothetical protein [uncultured archaeon]